MKKVLFILSLIIGYSCSSEIPFDKDGVENAVTRRVSSDEYSFEIYGGALASSYQYNCKGGLEGITPAVVSYYKDNNNTIEPIIPQILTKPVWIDSVAYTTSMYAGMFVVYVYMQNNTSSVERSGDIVWQQLGSNKTLSIKVVQEAGNNPVRVSVEQTYNNRYLFTATSTYPVKDEVRVRVPFEVYNDGGKLDHGALMVIPKGGQTGTYLMDFNASPLVYYHGDLKGYNLFEGSIIGDDVYTYEFYRYW